MATLAGTAPLPDTSAAELRALSRLAGPVIIAELGWMAMWIVDTMLVGRVGAEAIGAVSVGGNLFFTIAVFGIGLLLGLDYAVAHAHGAGRMRDAHEALVDGLYLATVASSPSRSPCSSLGRAGSVLRPGCRNRAGGWR